MTHWQSSSLACDDELQWLAFRYVAEELTEEERESFEARLLDDLAACEAVASMSETAAHLQLAMLAERSEPVKPAEDPRSARVRIRAWIAVGSTMIALCWLVLLLGDSGRRTVVESPEVTLNSGTQSAADLIARWTQVSEEAEFADDLLEVTPIELSSQDSAGRPVIPGWMLAAVSLEQSGSAADDMPDMPSNTKPVEVKEN